MLLEYNTENYQAGVLSPVHSFLKEKKSVVLAGYNKPSITLVSAVIITLNEEAIIERTLAGLWWCDEIIIIDSGSTDRTVELCKQQGCSVFFHSFTGFGQQKNYGVAKAKNNWILCIDADEILSEKLIAEIRHELNTTEIRYAAFTIPRNLVFMKKAFKHGKESGSSLIRLFDKSKGGWDGAIVHEKVFVDGAVKHLKNKILHYSYNSYGQCFSKINLYSSLGAVKLLEKKSGKAKALVVLAIPFNFFKYYFIDRNFLNGYRGFVWAVFNTFYHFLKYLKLDELKRRA